MLEHENTHTVFRKTIIKNTHYDLLVLKLITYQSSRTGNLSVVSIWALSSEMSTDKIIYIAITFRGFFIEAILPEYGMN